MDPLRHAVEFVRRAGNEIEQIRLQVLLAKPVDITNAVTSFAQTQAPNGGWAPFWIDSSALDSTCFRLAQLEQLGLTPRESIVSRALQFLSRHQHSDGSWAEDEQFSDVAPPWCKPGELSAQLYVTSNCAYWLAVFGYEPDRVRAAAEFLARHVEASGRMPSFLHTHWLSVGVLQAGGYQPTAEVVLSYLQSRVVDLDASSLAWMMGSLLGAGLERHHVLLVQTATRLLTTQEQDGRWRSADGPDHDVHVTLEAIRALTRMAPVPSS